MLGVTCQSADHGQNRWDGNSVLDGDSLVRLQSAEKLDALNGVHGDHDPDDRDSRPSEMDQCQVDVWVFLVYFLCRPSVSAYQTYVQLGRVQTLSSS